MRKPEADRQPQFREWPMTIADVYRSDQITALGFGSWAIGAALPVLLLVSAMATYDESRGQLPFAHTRL